MLNIGWRRTWVTTKADFQIADLYLPLTKGDGILPIALPAGLS